MLLLFSLCYICVCVCADELVNDTLVASRVLMSTHAHGLERHKNKIVPEYKLVLSTPSS